MQKNKWTVPSVNRVLQKKLIDELHISSILATLLINRGYTNTQEILEFLNPDLHKLSSPFQLLNMGAAVEKILQNIDQGRKIMVYGDYDVDGICASVILYQGLQALGAQVDYYVPDRLEEGYGINQGAMQSIYDSGAELVVTVDCGISAVEEIRVAQAMGLDVIVTDHHQLPATVPTCIIVDPAMVAESTAFKDLCGAGVAFMLVRGLFEKAYGQEASLSRMLPYLDLAALATVADIVALRGDNRIIVKYGLEQMQLGERPGLAALWKIARSNENAPINTAALGFGVAPRLNACGRIGDVNLGLRLLITDDVTEAEEIADMLDAENKNRQAIEREIFEEALAKVETAQGNLQEGLIVVGDDWHPGVIGIVASRLVDKFYTPTIILTKKEGGYKGSGRSISGFHLQQALAECSDYLESFGGHSQAAGLCVSAANLAAFQERFAQVVATHTTADTFIPNLQIDSEITLNDLNNDIFNEIGKIQPTGAMNPPPIFVCRGQTTTEARTVGTTGAHLRIKLRTNQGEITGIGFNKAELESLVQAGSVDIAFNLDKNTYNGKTRLQLLIKDIKSYRRPDQLNLVDRLFFYEQDYLHGEHYQGIEHQAHFFTKVVGVTFEGRQQALATLQEGQTLELVREMDNAFDANAIAVYSGDQQVGYLKKELAAKLAPNLDEGIAYGVLVAQITGGDTQSQGVNIAVRKLMPLAETAQIEQSRAHWQSMDDRTLFLRIKEALIGQQDYREKQQEALDFLLAGHDVLAIMGTGRGKSAIFQTYGAYLALRRQMTTIIVYPLRALVNDQYQALQRKLAPLGLAIAKGTGALEGEERLAFFQQLDDGATDMILTTPEFLAYHQHRFAKLKRRIGLVVVDEAHHVASRRQGYKVLPSTIKAIGAQQVLAVTATANEETAEQLLTSLNLTKTVLDPYVRTNLQLIDQRQCQQKVAYLTKLVARGEKTVIYVNSRKQAVKLAQILREKAPGALQQAICYYHGGLATADRQAVEVAFREGSLRVIVTTSAFGEGIDIPDISHVVLYHLSFSREEYNQLAGRAGRNGAPATIHLLYQEQDQRINQMLLEATSPSREALAQFYRLLKRLAASKGVLEMSNQELAAYGEMEKIAGLTEAAASHWLGIFEELGFLERERLGNQRKITLATHPAKVDLSKSLRYLEGLAEREDYEKYLPIAFDRDQAHLLDAINKPIFPEQWLSHSEGGVLK